MKTGDSWPLTLNFPKAEEIMLFIDDENVVGIYQFGSHGTPTQTPLSDIDICIFTRTVDNKLRLHYKSFGTKMYDISIFDDLPLYVKADVFRGKLLHTKDKQYLISLFAKTFRAAQDFRKHSELYWSHLQKKVGV